MASKSRLRLALVTETFPPEVNGVARTLGRWVSTFRSRGHDVRIIRPRQSNDPPAFEYVHGVPLPFYPQVRLGFASPMRLRSIFLRSLPDLIHIATEGPLGVAALMAANSLGVPVASSFHTNFDQYLTHYGIAGFEAVAAVYLAWFHNQTHVTLAPGESACRRLQSIGVRETKVWSRGVDGDVFHPAHRDPELRQKLGLGDDDLLLLYVGRLAPEKNLVAALDSFERVQRIVPEDLRERLRYALVGDGPSAASLAGRRMKHVILPGEMHGHELSRWYASADLFVFPSRSETFGNAVLEAQASGLPVVGYDCQGVNERVLHGTDGFLAKSDAEFDTALTILCTEHERRASYARAARAKAECQDWSTIFDHLESLYRRLLQERKETGVSAFNLTSGSLINIQSTNGKSSAGSSVPV
jgi:glycosyltransferase involved in cell wall biosynthesis